MDTRGRLTLINVSLTQLILVSRGTQTQVIMDTILASRVVLTDDIGAVIYVVLTDGTIKPCEKVESGLNNSYNEFIECNCFNKFNRFSILLVVGTLLEQLHSSVTSLLLHLSTHGIYYRWEFSRH
jgi:hypothetical protein